MNEKKRIKLINRDLRKHFVDIIIQKFAAAHEHQPHHHVNDTTKMYGPIMTTETFTKPLSLLIR